MHKVYKVLWPILKKEKGNTKIIYSTGRRGLWKPYSSFTQAILIKQYVGIVSSIKDETKKTNYTPQKVVLGCWLPCFKSFFFCLWEGQLRELC